jgi:hypothetical protein
MTAHETAIKLSHEQVLTHTGTVVTSFAAGWFGMPAKCSTAQTLRWRTAIMLTVLCLTTSKAIAHERRDVGPYKFVVGFLTEPVFEGVKNGVDLRVLQAETKQPVEGLEHTLQVEITYVPSGVAKVLLLRTIYREPGRYTADLIPTAPGQYRFRFIGSIVGTAVNEAFDSRAGGGQFDDVESSTDIQFPERQPAMREMQSAVRGTQQTAQQAQDASFAAQAGLTSAQRLAMVGIVLGALGIATGVGAVVVASRKR